MVAAMFCAGVATFAQLYAPQPVLPAISADLGIPAASSALMISAATLGLAIFALPWTFAADRWGKSRAMFIALITATALGLLIPWLPGYGMLLTARLLQGAMLAGTAGLAVAFITEETYLPHAGAATGLYVAGTTIGGLAGRMITGPVVQWTGQWRMGLLAVALVAAAAGALFMWLLPSARRFEPVPARGALRSTIRRTHAHLRRPEMLSLFLLAFVLMGAFVTVYNYVAYMLELPPYLLSPAAISLLFLAYLSGTATSSAAGRWAERFGRGAVISSGAVLMSLGIGATLVPSLPWVVVGMVMLTMGFFAAHSVASSWTGEMAGTAKAQGTALYNQAYYLGSAMIGWIGGFFFEAGGWPVTAWFCVGLVCCGSAAALTVLLRGRRPPRKVPV